MYSYGRYRFSIVNTVVIDNQNTTRLNYIGNWSTHNDYQIPSTTNPRPYMQTSAGQSSVSVNFTGAVSVAVNGNRNWGHGKYNVVRMTVKPCYISND